MAIKNRFFKTTQGVAFDFVLAKTMPSVANNTTSWQSIVNSAVPIGAMYALRVEMAAGANFGHTRVRQTSAANTLRTAVVRADEPTRLAWCTSAATNPAQFIETPEFTPGSISSIERIQTVAAANQVGVLVSSGYATTKQELCIRVIETTPGKVPLPSWDYNIYGGSEASQFDQIVTKINKKAEEEFFTAVNPASMTAPVLGAISGTTTVTAVALTTAGSNIYTVYTPNGDGQIPIVFSGGTGSGAAGYIPVTNGVAGTPVITAPGTYTVMPTSAAPATISYLEALILTSIDPTRTFRIVGFLTPTKGDLVDYQVNFSYDTQTVPNAGSGLFYQIEEMYKEAQVKEGIGHFYITGQIQNTEMGLPPTLAAIMGSTSSTFDVFKITCNKTEVSKTPSGVLTNRMYIFVVVESSIAGTVATNLLN